MNPKLEFFLNIAKFYSLLSKNLDAKLGGLGMNDFIVLHYLQAAPRKKLKRIELAEKVGMTASGVTRLLLPMEKIGLIGKEKNPNDARISYVILAPGGERMLQEAYDRMDEFSKDLISKEREYELENINHFISEIGGKMLWK